MIFKNLAVAIFVMAFCITVSAKEPSDSSVVIANEDSCNTETIQSAIDACILLAQSAETNDTIALRKAKEAMAECDFVPFGSLRKENKTGEESLDGHLVFNVAFADSLAEGKDAYNNSDIINKIDTHRGMREDGQVHTRTIVVKAKGKSIYKFPSHERQELAVVAEPGGLVTTRVHVVNTTKGIDEWHNDTTDVKKGKNTRKTAFTLPISPASQVYLEITNCTNKDISVVVISN